MNIQVKHNNTDISDYVIRYDREHKICNGIGMLELELDYNYSGSLDPWDAITVYEEGKLAAKYFISKIDTNQPSATFLVTAQDNSKRLSDYFIPDSYLIDYPSYARYWIELFLKEAGISYKFTVNDNGSLLSNNTALGLMSAYEQIIQLLQLSGWYMTFDSGGKAIIGKLMTSGNVSESVGNKDIIEIKVDKNDRMYRNRVVVWGHGDPSSTRWVFADVNKPTKWDYDARDKRTILISNTNIPTVSSAFSLANQVIAEFARLNIEKYVTVTGARDIHVGDTVYVKNRVFTGKGLVTTFGVSMSKEGLVSNISMDERCPRLFGYFNFGGYVYVGTFGDGVWRKHILTYSGSNASGIVLSGFANGVVPTGWFNYSSGLDELNVTDLHVNAGVLASVTASGKLYYSLEDESIYSGATVGKLWSLIPLSGLQVVYSGQVLEPTMYSGLMGRACIIDRDSNYLRYAVDTRSGINQGDFLMETDSMRYYGLSYAYPSGNMPSSGIYPSGGPSVLNHRAWVIDADPYDGSINGTYPVYMSGLDTYSGYTLGSGFVSSGVTLNMSVFDIENDGSNDYISAATVLSGQYPKSMLNGEYDLCRIHGVWDDLYNDVSEYMGDEYSCYMSFSGYPTPITQSFSNHITAKNLGRFWDSAPESDSYHATTSANASNKLVVQVIKSTVQPDGTLVKTAYVKTTTMSYSQNPLLAVTRDNYSSYNFYINSNKGSNEISRINYNTTTDTVKTELVSKVLPVHGDCVNLLYSINAISRVVSKGVVYTAYAVGTEDGFGFEIKLNRVDIVSGASSTSTVYIKSGTGTSNVGDYVYNHPFPQINILGNGRIDIYCPYIKRTYKDLGMLSMTLGLVRYIGGSVTDEEVDDWSAHFREYTSDWINRLEDIDLIHYNINKDSAVYIMRWGNVNSSATAMVKSLCEVNGVRYEKWEETEEGYTPTDIIASTYYQIYYMNSSMEEGVGRLFDNTITRISPSTGLPTDPVPHPAGFTLYSFSGLDGINGDLFFKANPDAGILYNVISLNKSGRVTRICNAMDASPSEKIMGNYRYTDNGVYFVGPGIIYGYFPMYVIMQRSGWDYNVLKSGWYRDRLDISNYSPLVAMGRNISTTETYFISQDKNVLQTTHVGISGYNLGGSSASGSMFTLGYKADDFRYSSFGDAVESGSSTQLFVAYRGDLGTMPLVDGSSFSGVMLSPSGYINRIEISNYSFPDQYMFVSVSGYTSYSGEWGFFQKSPTSTISGYVASGIYDTMSGTFVDCSSGYPQARTTIIRLDDRL